MAELSLMSLNVERSKHLDRVIPFLGKQHADVVCIQELMERDIPAFEQVAGSLAIFSPYTQHSAEGNPGVMGIAIFSALPVQDRKEEWYARNSEGTPDFDMRTTETKHATENHSIIFCDVVSDNSVFRIGTTHFTWTPDGAPDLFQREDLKKLLAILDESGEFVLTGDFNAPRGGEIFSVIASRYKDNIPSQSVTSLDQVLHRAAKNRPHEIENKMVDGLFTTPAYSAENVALVSGVSDHCAIVADIYKT